MQPILVPTLRELALIADGCRGALVGPGGEIGWACFPGFDSPALFTSLLGGASAYRITPEGRFVWGGYYEEGSLIWRSRWVLDDGAIVECREALAYPGEPDKCVVLRHVEVRTGSARVTARLDLRPDFGRDRLPWTRTDAGCWQGRRGEVHARWTGVDGAQGRDDGSLEVTRLLREGQSHDYVLELSSVPFDSSPPAPDAMWDRTKAAWSRRLPPLAQVAATRDARHAAAVLLGLSTPGGGTVAAATTSLPERAESGRSYDYRYVWIRDQCYVGVAAAVAGFDELVDGAVSFVRDRLLADGSELRPAYTSSGAEVPEESELSHLPGYPGGQTILIGNQAGRQFQLDAFGEALLLFAQAAQAGRLDAAGWRAAEVAATAVEQRWTQAGAGIWETEPRLWTHSRLICAAGLRQLAAAAPGPGLPSRWIALSDRLVAEADRTALTPEGNWVRAPDDPRVDAALLLPGLRGAVPPDDPRSRETLSAVVRELGAQGFCYRYRAQGLPLGEAEGAFNLCNFWVALSYWAQGDRVEGARWFERARGACGPPGLFSEEFDVTQRQLRGNVPQAFVHAELLEAAARLGTDA